MPEIALSELPTRLQRQADNARVALERGNAEYAVTICRSVLAQHPGCLPLRRLLRAAQVRALQGRSSFLVALTGALRAGPAVFAGRRSLAREPAKAIDAAERALTAQPRHTGALRLLAQAATALELPVTAVFALEAAVELRPHDRTVQIELADALIAVGRSADALAIGERALKKRPGDPALQELIKRASVAQSIAAGKWDADGGDYREQLRDADRAVALEQDARVNTSEEASRRQIAEAKARLESEPTNLKHFRALVAAHRALGETDAALEWLQRARAVPAGAGDVSLERLQMELQLAQIEARVHAAESAGDAGAMEAARREHAARRLELLRGLADKYPNEPDFRLELGECLMEAGDVDGAIQHFQAVRRHPKLRITALRRLGEAFQTKGLHDLAVQQYETAKTELTEFDREKKEVTYQLAACLEAMGQPEKAIEEYKLIYAADIAFRDVAEKIARSYAKE